MSDHPILRLDIDHKTKATRVTGYIYMETDEEVCIDGFCLPFGGVAYTVCEVK